MVLTFDKDSVAIGIHPSLGLIRSVRSISEIKQSKAKGFSFTNRRTTKPFAFLLLLRIGLDHLSR